MAAVQVLLKAVHQLLLQQGGFSASPEEEANLQTSGELLSVTYVNQAKVEVPVSFLVFGDVIVLNIVLPGHSKASSCTLPISRYISLDRSGVQNQEELRRIISELLQPPSTFVTDATSTTARTTEPTPSTPAHFPTRISSPNVSIPPFRGIGSGDLDPFSSGSGSGMFAGPRIFQPWPSSELLQPRSAIPPGARFDPVFPGGNPRIDPSGRFTTRMDPDNDEFQPPGYEDMFS